MFDQRCLHYTRNDFTDQKEKTIGKNKKLKINNRKYQIVGTSAVASP